MHTQKLTDTEIAIRIVPKRLRWPEAGRTAAWTKAHDCVDALRLLVRNTDSACVEAEQNPDFSASAIARRRTELCEHALSKLVNFRPFEIAEKALAGDIDALERLDDRNPQQVQMLLKLKQAREDLREGIPATQRMVRERCKLRESVSV